MGVESPCSPSPSLSPTSLLRKHLLTNTEWMDWKTWEAVLPPRRAQDPSVIRSLLNPLGNNQREHAPLQVGRLRPREGRHTR